MAKAKEVQEIELPKVYELGSHIISSLSEEEVNKVYEGLKDLVTTAGGKVLSEEAPQLMDLAYIMIKHVQGKNIRHSTANFSWIKFEIDPSVIPAIHESVSANENVLRFIIVKTVAENTLYGHKFPQDVKEEKGGKRDYRREKTEVAESKPVAAVEAEQVVEAAVN
jgi:ribosomal protein S6